MVPKPLKTPATVPALKYAALFLGSRWPRALICCSGSDRGCGALEVDGPRFNGPNVGELTSGLLLVGWYAFGGVTGLRVGTPYDVPRDRVVTAVLGGYENGFDVPCWSIHAECSASWLELRTCLDPVAPPDAVRRSAKVRSSPDRRSIFFP